MFNIAFEAHPKLNPVPLSCLTNIVRFIRYILIDWLIDWGRSAKGSCNEGTDTNLTKLMATEKKQMNGSCKKQGWREYNWPQPVGENYRSMVMSYGRKETACRRRSRDPDLEGERGNVIYIWHVWKTSPHGHTHLYGGLGEEGWRYRQIKVVCSACGQLSDGWGQDNRHKNIV